MRDISDSARPDRASDGGAQKRKRSTAEVTRFHSHDITPQIPPQIPPPYHSASTDRAAGPGLDEALLAHALAYAARGWPVLPCRPRGKEPLVAGGYQAATTDPATIRGWWRRWPEANIGVPTGRVSGIVVLDVDPRNGGDETLLALPPLPETVEVVTGGGGRHVYFRAPDREIRCRPNALGPGLDLKAEGGYVLAPPSVHPTGRAYEWELSSHPDEVPIAPMPVWLVERLAEPEAASATRTEGERIPEGRRNVTLTSLAGSMRRRGMTREAIEAALLAENAARCDPPLPEGEIRQIARSVSRYAPVPTLAEKDPGGATEEAMDRAVPVEPVQEQAAEEHRRKGASALLVELAEGAGVELFHDPAGDAWASVRCDNHAETYPLRSRAFRSWLAGHFYRREGRPPGAQALADALDVLESRARFDGSCCAVHVRLAEHGGCIFLDLGDPAWRAVEIGQGGWRITPAPSVRFWRPQGLLLLPEPVRGGSLTDLRPFVNGDDTAFVLIAAWLLGALHPHGPYPILLLTGEQGSGKSTLARMLRGLVDPSEAALRRPPRDERDVFVAASNSWVVGFDNLSAISGWLSDALCVMSTGGAFSSRRLYTDREETLLAAKRPVIVTAIGDVLAEPDLRDRVLKVELQRLDEASVVDEATLAHRFEEARPRILGALLDAAAAALRCWDQVRLNRTPRMADFCRWVVAAELGGALPWTPGTFLSAYLEHRAALAAGILDDPVAAAVVRLVGSGPWSGTATELLSELESQADERATRQRSWPQSPEGLALRLRRLAPELRRASGVDVSFAREPGTGRRIIALEGTGGNPSHPPHLSLGSGSPCAPRVPGPRSVTGLVTGQVNLSHHLSHPPGAESLVSQGVAARGDSPDRGDSDLPPYSGLSHEEGEGGDIAASDRVRARQVDGRPSREGATVTQPSLSEALRRKDCVRQEDVVSRRLPGR